MKFMISLLFLSSFVQAFDEVIKKEKFKISEYKTVSGYDLSNLSIGYETYGKLNADKSNVILIAHFFTGTSHAAGKYTHEDVAPGYWDSIVGPGKALDTDKYFIISSDTLVNLTPDDKNTITTGPTTINPKTKKPFGMNFPHVTVRDFVHVQRKLLDSLGIKKLFAVMGPSGGAAQAMEWAVAYPDDVSKVIAVIGPGLSLPAYTVAMLDFWYNPIMNDPQWNNGNYKKGSKPLNGLIESLKQITFTAGSFEWAEPIGRKEISSTLTKRASDRAMKVDANSVIYMARAMQAFDVENEADKVQAQVYFIPTEKDMIFPPRESEKAVKKLCSLGKSADFTVMKSVGGHIDGVTKIALVEKEISAFLNVPVGKKWGCSN